MLDRIQRFFSDHIAPAAKAGAEAEDERQIQIATAALFVEMTRADFQITDEERAAVLSALERVLDLGPEEAAELVELADAETEGSVCLFQFTQLVNREYDLEQKKRVVELLWRIAHADAVVEQHEEFFVRKIARLLHVPHRDFIDAKRRARDDR